MKNKKYDVNEMTKQGVYKIHQINYSPREKIKLVFDRTKIFLDNALKLGGHVLVCKD